MNGVDCMHVVIRLPLSVLFEGNALKLTAVSSIGSFGLLPNHVDFVSDLQPSVLSLWNTDVEEQLFGIDEGLLIKQSNRVSVIVRRALQGDDLDNLYDQIIEYFLTVDDEERRARAALSRLEANMARGFTRLRRDQV